MNCSITRLRVLFGVLFALHLFVLVTPSLYYRKFEYHVPAESVQTVSMGVYYACETWPDGETNSYGDTTPCYGQAQHTYPGPCDAGSEPQENSDTLEKYCQKWRTFQVFETVGAISVFAAVLILIVSRLNQYGSKRNLLILIWTSFVLSLIGLSVYINLEESLDKPESNPIISFTHTYSYSFAAWVIAVAGSLVAGIALLRAEVDTGSATGYFLSGA